MPEPPLTIQGILGPDGMLARSLSGFEFRPSQLKMALLIEDSIKKNVPVMVEAGTGTGKTFGYLVPAILSRKKAIISTGTKNLQEQIYFKDIPLLGKTTGLEIDAVIMKGRKNYLCLHRYHQYLAQLSLLKTVREEKREGLEEWLKKTEFGDRSEIPWMEDDDDLWDAVSSTSEQCLGSSCMFLDDCYLGRLRTRAARSRIIIVNHHLFFADLKVRMGGFAEVIPRFQLAIFDEAHAIEEIATSYFGESLSTNQIAELAGDLKKGLKGLKGVDRENFKVRLTAIEACSESIRGLLDRHEERGRIDRETLTFIREGPARDIDRNLRFVREMGGLEELDNARFQPLLSRADDLTRALEQLLKEREDNWLHWYEKRKNGLALHASPLDISESMKELLYENVKSLVFTSATLSTNNSFDFFQSRLGLGKDALKGIYPSHFSFETQTLMYVPNDLPAPTDPNFATEIAKKIQDILTRSKGRALVLFTSYSNLNMVYQIIKKKIPYTIHRQGHAPRSVLLNVFRQDIHSVLLATRSFWQGVDVPGEALSCLIIDRLPFDSPAEPLVEARIDSIRNRGGNPFIEYQVPSAIISFKQGLGRLIRKGSDRGILSVLDIRILTRRYGRLFLDSLPHIPLTHNPSDIDRFFGVMKGEQNGRRAVEDSIEQKG